MKIINKNDILNGNNDIVGISYEIELTDKESEEVGAYYSNITKGRILFHVSKNYETEILIGVAEGYGQICSYTHLNDEEFTKENIKKVKNIIFELFKD